jgi:hypothetical protein
MHPTLCHFIRQYLFVMVAALLPVVLTTFISMPISFGGHPGEIRNIAMSVDRHLS